MKVPQAQVSPCEQIGQTGGPPVVWVTTNFLLQRFNVSSMSIYRLEHSETSGFPKPIRIQRRKYYDLALVMAWERQLRERAASSRFVEERVR